MKFTHIRQVADVLHSPCSFDSQINGFAVDSRTMEPGQVFVALPGAKTDGHHFLQETKEKGAVGAIVNKHYRGDSYGLPLLYVDSPIEALQELARHLIRKRTRQKVVGITGSVGKTTAKDFTSILLGGQFSVAKSLGNRNSQIGLPLTIVNDTDGSEDALVLEMSMSQKGEIETLVSIAPPEVCLITLVSAVHICYFEDERGIAEAKGEILGHSKTKLAILPHDSPHFGFLKSIGTCKKISFSEKSPEADYFLSTEGNRLRIIHRKKIHEMGPLTVPGIHNRYNFLAAAAIAHSLGVSWDVIRERVPSLILPPQRLQRTMKEGIVFINDSYNAGVLSMKAALDSLPQPGKEGRRIAVFGEMLELGKLTESSHREIGQYALDKVDMAFCVGNGCSALVDVWKKNKKNCRVLCEPR